MKTKVYISLYKRTGQYKAYYFALGTHVYIDGLFETASECAQNAKSRGFDVNYDFSIFNEIGD